MNSEWLHWYYLIYWLPFAIAVGVLLISGMGGHHAQGGHGGHAGLSGHMGPGGHGGAASHSGLAGHAAASHAAPVHAAPAHGGPVHGAHSPAAGSHTGPGNRPDSTLQQELRADWHSDHHHLNLGWRTSHTAHGTASDRDALGLAGQLLSFFGFGRAPITILAASLMIGWGLSGLMTTEYIETPTTPPSLFILPALIAAVLGALFFTKFFGELAARFTPDDETYAVSRESLVGLTGSVVYPVTETGGRIHVFDQHRTLHVEPARMRAGRPPAARGEEVIVYQVDPVSGCLLVDTAAIEAPVGEEAQAGDSPAESAPSSTVAATAVAAEGAIQNA